MISMKQINLTNGDVCLIDDENYYLNKYKWYLSKGYPATTIEGKMVLMHRLILNVPKDYVVDHINGNPCDNRLSNLRKATVQQNNFNRRALNRKIMTSYKGVFWIKEKSLFRVEIKKDRKPLFIGYFKNEHIGAYAYNVYAKQLFGEFAKLNDVPKYENWVYEKVYLTKTTLYRGVTRQRNGKFQARLTINKKRISIGYFNTAEEAAVSYNQFALEHLGDKALLNKIK